MNDFRYHHGEEAQGGHIHEEEHTHTAADGTVITHTHGEIHEEEHFHTHIAPDGSTYTHSHDHIHQNVDEHGHVHGHGSHTHTHDPKEVRKIINRLSRSIGHLESVKRMVEEGQDCADVLVQLAAVRSELNGTGKALLKQHLEHCIVEAVEEHDDESVAKINQAIDQFMK